MNQTVHVTVLKAGIRRSLSFNHNHDSGCSGTACIPGHTKRAQPAKRQTHLAVSLRVWFELATDGIQFYAYVFATSLRLRKTVTCITWYRFTGKLKFIIKVWPDPPWGLSTVCC